MPGEPGNQGRPTGRLALRYGRVFFDLRSRLDLTVHGCLLLDVIDSLSRKTGWSYASRGYLANLLGCSPRSLRRLISSLVEKKLLEIHKDDARKLRTASRWRAAKADLGA